MKLGADDANRLLALIGHLHDAGTTEEIAAVCREGLTPIVPADICDLVVLAPQDDRHIGTPGGYTAAEIEAVLAMAFEHPVVAHHATHGDCGPCSVSDFLPLDRWRDTAFYALGNRRLRQDYEIATNLPGGSATGLAGLAGLSLSREDRDFDDRERTILGYLRGPLALVLRRSLDREKRSESISAEALAARFPQLTRREAEVLMCIVAGKRDSEIAAILGVRLPPRPRMSATCSPSSAPNLGLSPRWLPSACPTRARRCPRSG